MPTIVCRISTPNASLYIKKLCKHFAHKVEVSFDDELGCCQLPTGQVNMKAADAILTFEISAETTEGVETCKFVVEDHFLRFSRNENIETLVWSES